MNTRDALIAGTLIGVIVTVLTSAVVYHVVYREVSDLYSRLVVVEKKCNIKPKVVYKTKIKIVKVPVVQEVVKPEVYSAIEELPTVKKTRIEMRVDQRIKMREAMR